MLDRLIRSGMHLLVDVHTVGALDEGQFTAGLLISVTVGRSHVSLPLVRLLVTVR